MRLLYKFSPRDKLPFFRNELYLNWRINLPLTAI